MAQRANNTLNFRLTDFDGKVVALRYVEDAKLGARVLADGRAIPERQTLIAEGAAFDPATSAATLLGRTMVLFEAVANMLRSATNPDGTPAWAVGVLRKDTHPTKAAYTMWTLDGEALTDAQFNACDAALTAIGAQ